MKPISYLCRIIKHKQINVMFNTTIENIGKIQGVQYAIENPTFTVIATFICVALVALFAAYNFKCQYK